MRPFLVATLVCCFFSIQSFAQSMTAITPNHGPNTGSVIITGSGFSTTPRATRFVDNANADVFIGVSCASTVECSAYPRSGLAVTGSALNFAVFALVNGMKSGSFATYMYYGPPAVTSIVPSSSATASGTTNIVINGGTFTDDPSYPGMTSIYLNSYISDRAGGCATTIQCTGVNAPSVVSNGIQGAYLVRVDTPGGSDTASYFRYGTTPATPTVTSVTPNQCATGGGCAVTITGTNFLTGANATKFKFYAIGTNNDATGVNCSSSTTCTATVPPGSVGPAGVEVFVVCPANTACAGTIQSASVPTTKTGAFSYSGLKIDPGSAATLLTTENGGATQFNVSLHTQPSANVSVAVATAGGRATLSASTLTFTTSNWATPQAVTVTGRDDTGVGGAAAPGSGNMGYSVTTLATSADSRYNNVNGNDQSLTNLDNETAQVFISPAHNQDTTEGGGTAVFTVALTKVPSSTVTINLASNDPTEGTVSPASLTFLTSTGNANSWNVPRTVTVTGVSDGAADGDILYNILISLVSADPAYTALFLQDLFVTNKETSAVASVRGDFNGDGRSDLVWRHTSGLNAMWFMNGTAIGTSGMATSLDTSWSIAGSGDFDGDGKWDLFWRHSSGLNAIWLMNGTATGSSGFVPTLDASWTLAGTGDFDNDGKSDVLWRHNTGLNAIWFMNGAAIGSSAFTTTLATSWTLAATGDFDGNGSDDLMWRHTTGLNAVWLMNGTAISTSGYSPTLDGTWTLTAASDFNGDGTTDVMWRHDSGLNALWFMAGTAPGSSGLTTSLAAGWNIVGSGDYNGNGTGDLMWRHTSGQTAVWLLSGTTLGSSALTPILDGTWTPKPPKPATGGM